MTAIIDNRGRRLGSDRRKFSYDIYLPEKRSEKQGRRSKKGRRTKLR